MSAWDLGVVVFVSVVAAGLALLALALVCAALFGLWLVAEEAWTRLVVWRNRRRRERRERLVT